MINFENNKWFLIIITLLWFILSWWVIYYLVQNEYISKDLTNTYIVFPAWWSYHAKTWYLEYYLSKEGGWLNKYTANHMTNFPSYINVSDGFQ